MKSIQKHTSRKKLLLVVAIVLLLGAAGVGGYFVMANNSPQKDSSKTTESNNQTSLDPATTEQIEAGNSAKENTIKNDGKPNSGDSLDPPEAGATIGVSITAANQNSSVVNIRALINELINSGTCTLKLTKGSANVLKSVSVQALSSAATCQGFDVPTSELPAGNWHLTLTVTSGDRTGTAEHDISIQ